MPYILYVTYFGVHGPHELLNALKAIPSQRDTSHNNGSPKNHMAYSSGPTKGALKKSPQNRTSIFGHRQYILWSKAQQSQTIGTSTKTSYLEMDSGIFICWVVIYQNSIHEQVAHLSSIWKSNFVVVIFLPFERALAKGRKKRRALKEIISISTTCCDLVIAIRGEKMHK